MVTEYLTQHSPMQLQCNNCNTNPKEPQPTNQGPHKKEEIRTLHNLVENLGKKVPKRKYSDKLPAKAKANKTDAPKTDEVTETSEAVELPEQDLGESQYGNTDKDDDDSLLDPLPHRVPRNPKSPTPKKTHLRKKLSPPNP